jgi:hypothetical protein
MSAGEAQRFYSGKVGHLDWLSVLSKFRKRGIGQIVTGFDCEKSEGVGGGLSIFFNN